MEDKEIESGLDPIVMFDLWMKAAEASEPSDPTAVALATATRDGMPSVRMVLMKAVDKQGFVFYTNADSQKGMELEENPRAAMCFHWKSLGRQIRITGSVTELPTTEADRYFHTRARLSQLAAVASQQSRVLTSHEALVARVKELDARFPAEVPRPEYWKGFVLRPERIEFWKSREGRLHDRLLFVRSGEEWHKELLFP
ncbi:MAG TPA: pyridoxamine 5'-phosphate oxidase [Edaphobacter sp.]|jgi:pyridoxamine 5'-phosphate oxidase|nr:pyridoxamine 5'-phosphate oxidase [Edaphobacter sp.]